MPSLEQSMFKMYFLLKPILGPLEACFDYLDQEVLKEDYIDQVLVFYLKGNAVS